MQIAILRRQYRHQKIVSERGGRLERHSRSSYVFMMSAIKERVQHESHQHSRIQHQEQY